MSVSHDDYPRLAQHVENRGFTNATEYLQDYIDKASKPRKVGKYDAQIRVLVKAGATDREMALELGITNQSARARRQRLGLPINRSSTNPER